MMPVTAPAPAGVKVTGTDSVWPVVRDTGSAGGVTANGAEGVIPFTVTGLVAGTGRGAVPDEATFTLPRLRGGALRAEGVGLPKAMTGPCVGPFWRAPR